MASLQLVNTDRDVLVRSYKLPHSHERSNDHHVGLYRTLTLHAHS